MEKDRFYRGWVEKFKKDFRSKNRNNLNLRLSIIIFLNNIYNKFYSYFYHFMCKIAFSHIIQENSLQKGLFQLIANQD